MGDVANILNILTRDSIDADAVEESLSYATVKNFTNLYDIQRGIAGVRRYNIPFRDMKLVTRLKSDKMDRYYPRRYSYTIPKNIVTKGKEKACKELGLYDIPLTQSQIAEYPKIFNYNFLIVLDGMFVNTGDMIVSAESIMITIDVNIDKNSDDISRTGIPYDVYRKYYDNDAILSLFLIPNFNYGITSCRLDIYNNVLLKEIPFVRFTNRFYINEDNTMLFVNTDTDPSLLRRVDFTIKIITDTDKRIIIDPNVNITSDNINIVAINFDYLYSQIELTPEDDGWFQLTGYKLPVPIENIVPMVINDDNTWSTETNMSIRLYYPNIYQITNYPDGKTVRLCIFYKDSVDQAYTNDLLLLYILSGNLIDRYKNNQLPELVMNYSPKPVPYFSSDDFVNSVFYPNTTLYNIDRFKSIAEVDPDVLLKYLYRKMKYLPRYYVNVAKLDLPSRIRRNTEQEQDKIVDLFYFDEDNYLFSFSKSFIGTSGFDFRIFIDNYFISPYEYTYFPGADYYYFYIPTRLIKEDSIIEFEKHREYDYTVKGIVVNNEIHVELPDYLNNYGIYPRDIYLVTTDNNLYVDYYDYEIIAYNDILDKRITLNNQEYAKIYNDFTIKFTPAFDTSYEGREVLVNIYHKIITSTVDVDITSKTEFPYTIDIPSFNNAENGVIRAFGGGLMLPTSSYRVIPSGEYSVPAIMGFFVDKTFFQGTLRKLAVDVMPIDMVCEFRLDYIDNDYGLVDTKDSLSLPLDLKWYDIYVNGLKLNKYNVDIVTTNKFFVKGINSRRNLRIYARGDIYDEFMIEHNSTYDNFLYDEVDDIYKELIKDRDILRDTLTDIAEGVIEGLEEHFTFVNTVLKYTFINPNLDQITKKIIANYPELVDDTGMLTLITNQKYMDEVSMITPINSNVRSGIMRKHRYRYSFTPLHIGNHYDAENGEYMCDPITGSPCMKDLKGDIIPTGAIDRLNIHKNTFNEALAVNNLANLDVYHLEPENTAGVREVTKGDELLEEVIETNMAVTKFVVSIDMDILHKGCQDVMTTSDYNPIIEITFKNDIPDGITQTVKIALSILSTTVISANLDSLKLLSIKLLPENEDDTMEQYKCILHSILIAF